jgi:hypothetical protein
LRATLPKNVEDFAGLIHVKDISDAARTISFYVLLLCVYIWLTLGTTRDLDLLRNATTSKLPVIDASLSIVGFYLAAPALAFALFCYFCLNLQRLWESLADLPAVFPDGVTLDKKVDPWLLNGIVNTHFHRLRIGPPPLARLQSALSLLFAYAFAPLTFVLVWLRCLRRHDILLSSAHAVLVALSVGLASVFWILCRATLRGWEEGLPLGQRGKMGRWAKPRIHLGLNTALISFALLSLASVWLMSRGGIGAASLEGADLTGADLRGADLRYARLQKADLNRADLAKACLLGVDLREAKNLTQQQLESAEAWKQALLPQNLLAALALAPDHNRLVMTARLPWYALRRDCSP